MPRFIALALTLTISAAVSFAPTHAEAMLSSAEVNTLNEKAQKGDIQAQAELAKRYFKGDGVKQNYKKAARWYLQLAEKDVADAQLTLGLMYIRGNGVQQDDTKAIHWLTMAAEQRVPTAQYLLGLAYAEGHGVDKDLTKAFMWYEIAAALGYKDAVDARTNLEKRLPDDIVEHAEQMANEWWMRFHH